MIFELLMSYGSERGYSIGFNRSFSPKPVGTGTQYDEILSNSDLLTILTKIIPVRRLLSY
jgi:hypothetical protein